MQKQHSTVLEPWSGTVLEDIGMCLLDNNGDLPSCYHFDFIRLSMLAFKWHPGEKFHSSYIVKHYWNDGGLVMVGGISWNDGSLVMVWRHQREWWWLCVGLEASLGWWRLGDGLEASAGMNTDLRLCAWSGYHDYSAVHKWHLVQSATASSATEMK